MNLIEEMGVAHTAGQSRIRANLIYVHPNRLNPVKFNDVAFAIHGFFVSMLFICQCIAYERGQQRVSGVFKFILFGVFTVLGWLIYKFSNVYFT